jgi:hypothetical protein
LPWEPEISRFPISFSTKILYAFLLSPILATCSAHPSS